MVTENTQKSLDELSGGRAILKNVLPVTPENLIEILKKDETSLTETEKKAVQVVHDAARFFGNAYMCVTQN